MKVHPAGYEKQRTIVMRCYTAYGHKLPAYIKNFQEKDVANLENVSE